LAKLRTAFQCRHCTACFPILFHVPLFFPRLEIRPSGYEISRETAKKVGAHFGLEIDSFSHYLLKQIFSYDYGSLGPTAAGFAQALARGGHGASGMAAPWRPIEMELNRHSGQKQVLHLLHSDMPMVPDWPAETWIVGAEIHLLQVAHLAAANTIPTRRFLAGNIHVLPFVAETFDCIVAPAEIGDQVCDLVQPLLRQSGFLALVQNDAPTRLVYKTALACESALP
jgi:hypothetical protein